MAGFLFYEDYYKVGSMIKDPEDRIQFYESIFERGLYGKPLGSTGNPVIDTSFMFIESLITANEQKRKDGAKGGRPKKQKTSGSEDKNHGFKKTETMVSSNVNVNKNFNVNENLNANDNSNANWNENSNASSPSPSGTAPIEGGGPSGVEDEGYIDFEWGDDD